MSDASAGVVSCESTARCARGSPAARAPTKLRTATVGCIGKRCPESRARARESLRTAVSSCGIAAWPGSPRKVARTQHIPFSATWIG